MVCVHGEQNRSTELELMLLGLLSLTEAQEGILDLVAAQGAGQGRTWSYTLRSGDIRSRGWCWQRRHHDNGSLRHRLYRGWHKFNWRFTGNSSEGSERSGELCRTSF